MEIYSNLLSSRNPWQIYTILSSHCSTGRTTLLYYSLRSPNMLLTMVHSQIFRINWQHSSRGHEHFRDLCDALDSWLGRVVWTFSSTQYMVSRFSYQCKDWYYNRWILNLNWGFDNKYVTLVFFTQSNSHRGY